MRILLAALVVMGGLHLIVARSIHDWDNIKPKPYAMDPYWVNFEDIFIDEYGYDSPETLEKLGPRLFHKYFRSNTESSPTTIQSERSSEEKVIHDDDDDDDNHRTGSIIINDNDGLGAIISMFVMDESNDKKNKANIESDESSDEKVIPDDDDNDRKDSAEQDDDEIKKIFGNNEYENEFTQFLKGFYPDENSLEEDYFAVTTSPKADTEDQKKLIENDKVMTDKQIDDILSMFFGVSSSDEKTEVMDETNENTENNYNEDHDNENRQTIDDDVDVDVNDNNENINNNANDIYTEMYRNIMDLAYKKLYKNTDQTNYGKYSTDFPHMLSLIYGSSTLNDDDDENKENNGNPTNDDDDKSEVVRNENVNDDESQEFNNHDDVIYLTVTINVDKPKTVPDQENDNIASIFDIFYQTLHKPSNNNNNNNEYENTNENPKDFYEIINNKDQDQVWNFKPLVSDKQETDKSFSSFDNSNNMEPHFFYQTLDESRNNNNNEYENPKDFYEIINNKDQDFKPLVSDNQETSKTVSSLDSSKMQPDFIYQKLYKPNNNNNNNLEYENEESSSFS